MGFLVSAPADPEFQHVQVAGRSASASSDWTRLFLSLGPYSLCKSIKYLLTPRRCAEEDGVVHLNGRSCERVVPIRRLWNSNLPCHPIHPSPRVRYNVVSAVRVLKALRPETPEPPNRPGVLPKGTLLVSISDRETHGAPSAGCSASSTGPTASSVARRLRARACSRYSTHRAEASRARSAVQRARALACTHPKTPRTDGRSGARDGHQESQFPFQLPRGSAEGVWEPLGKGGGGETVAEFEGAASEMKADGAQDVRRRRRRLLGACKLGSPAMA